MKKIVPLILATAMILVMGVFSFAQEKGSEMEEGKAAFEEFCGKCHDLERSLNRAKDRSGWERTVERMSNYHKRYGAPIPEDTQGAIAGYLAEVAGK